MNQPSVSPIRATGDIGVNNASFIRHLRAENLRPKTLETYSESVRQFGGFLAGQGMPQEVVNIHREHVEAFIEHLLERWKPATANIRYRGLQSFFRWLAEEGGIRESPMAKMKPPRVPEAPPDVLREDQLRALLATCDKGQSLEDRRDAAIIRVFIDTGARLAEATNLRWDPADDTLNDVDLELGQLKVLGKGRRERVLAIGRKTVRALDRYIRVRARHRDASLPYLWLASKGR